MLFIAFYTAAQINISAVHIHQENHIQTIFYRNCAFIILYDLWLLSCLFLLCKCLNMYAPAETHIVCVKTAFISLFLSGQVYIPSIIHISKRIYFQFYLSIYTLGGRGTLYTEHNYKCNTFVFAPIFHELNSKF